MDPLYVSALVFMVVAAAATVIYRVWDQQRQVSFRMAQVALQARRSVAAVGGPLPEDHHQMTRALLKWAVGRLGKPKVAARATVKLSESLVQAGFKSPSAPALFQLAKLLSTVCGLVLELFRPHCLG
jgi:hypothetical protein